MARRRDTQTLDLFSWEPPKVVARYDERRVRAADLRNSIAMAVGATLSESDVSREDIARKMSDWLGEEIAKSTLDAYAAPAKEAHTITFVRAIALAHVTGDRRLLQLAAEMIGCAVVEEKWLPWVDVGLAFDAKQDISDQFDAILRSARRGTRR